MLNFFKKFEIKLSIFIVLIFTIFFQITEYFILLLLFTLLHELAHILIAELFGLKCSKIIITPIGHMAILENLEFLSKFKKIIIVFAGPFLNIILVIICNFFTNEKMHLIKIINLSIAFFNLLPIYPLDGGRILLYTLDSKIGTLNSVLVIKKVSLIFSYVIFLIGFLQMIFISYNISLLCLAFYLIKINKNHYINFTFQFYKSIKLKFYLNKSKILKIKHILVDKSIPNKTIFSSLTQDYFTIINISDSGEIKWSITEQDFIKSIQLKGLNGQIYDLFINLDK